MELSSQPEPVLDQRFFHVTGVVMVLGTLMAGAIMLWLANDVGVTETPHLVTASRDSQATAFGEPLSIAGPITEVNFRVHPNEMVSNSR